VGGIRGKGGKVRSCIAVRQEKRPIANQQRRTLTGASNEDCRTRLRGLIGSIRFLLSEIVLAGV
jgi:hypothetical protein